jgi:hypothetical protein
MFLLLNLFLARLGIVLEDVDPTRREDHDKCRQLVADSFDYALARVKPHYVIDFIAQLPLTYISLLIAVRKILDRGQDSASFEGVFENYRQFAKVPRARHPLDPQQYHVVAR